MKSLITVAVLMLTLLIPVTAGDWVRVLDPSSVRIAASPTRKVVEIETWKARGHKNFVNLSF